jgi:hypothetical protein
MLVEDSPTSATSFTLEPLSGELGYTSDIQFLIDGYGYLRVDSTNVRAIANSLTYNGTFMQSPFLSVEVKSSHRVDFTIGDYIVWDYDGLTYHLTDTPKEDKKATEGSYGEAFSYELRFESAFSKLQHCSVLDVVPNENNEHFTALPNFSFYGDAHDLAARLNTNISRLYSDFSVIVDTTDPEISSIVSEEVNIDISNIDCLEALRIFYDQWRVGYVMYYDELTSKYTIKVGALGGDTTSFSYGKGNGLHLIAKTEDSSKVVTRVRAYGSSENLPNRYYNGLTDSYGTPLVGDMQYIPQLMIPPSKWGTTLGVPDVLKAYVDADNPDVDVADTTMAEYGIRERSVFFDGTDGRKDIKPTIKNITAGQLRAAIASYLGDEVYFTPAATYGDSERLDLIDSQDSTTDDGVVLAKEYYEETFTVPSNAGTTPAVAKMITIPIGSTNGATLTKSGNYSFLSSDVTFTVTTENLLLTDVILDVYINRNSQRVSKIGSFPAVLWSGNDKIIAVTTSLGSIYNIEILEEGDVYSFDFVATIIISDIDYGTQEDLAYSLTAGTITMQFTKKYPNDQFTVKLKQIGFDIKKYVAESGENPVLFINSGECAGREFEILDTQHDPIDDTWLLTCKRQSDDSIEQLFPNQYFHIKAGDKFVLLNLSMPTILVEIASLQLYDEACRWLRENKEPRYTVEPSVDEIYMAHNPQVIKEGMLMPLVDTDLEIDESIIINSVTITETGDKLREYSVVLREDIDEDLSTYLAKTNQRQTVRTLNYIVNAKTNKTKSSPTFAPASASTSVTTTGDYHPYGGGLIDFRAAALRSSTLVVPNAAPAEGVLETGEWGIYIGDTGFGGETPPASGDISLGELNDVTFGTLSTNQAPVYNTSLGYFTNQTVSLDGHNHSSLYYTKAEVNALVGSVDYHPLYGLDGGTTPLDFNADKLIMSTLVLPTTTPSLTTGEWALYIGDTGFGGETPASPTINTLSDIPDTSLSTATTGDMIIRDSSGQWIATPFTHDHSSLYYTKSEVTALVGGVSVDAYTTSEINDFFSGVTAITGYSKTNWDTAYSQRHTHSNKSVLDDITTTDLSQWDTAYLDSHSHANKSVLDGITTTKVNAWDGVVTDFDGHDHDDLYYTKTYINNNLRIPTSAPTNPETGAWYLYIA